MTISPTWVICALEEGDFKQLEAKLQRQFKAISYNEVGIDFDESTKRWWKITNIAENAKKILNETVDEQGRPFDIPALNSNLPFDLYKFTVIYIAPATNFAKLFPIAKELQQAYAKGRLLNGSQVIKYGLCLVSKGEPLPTNLKTKIKAFVKEEEPVFDKLLFQGDTNKGANNRLGYSALLEKEDKHSAPRHNIHDLSVQIICHLALSRDKVNDINLENRLQTVGAYSLTFEKEVEKANHASKISKNLFKKFCDEKADERWFNKQDAVISTDISSSRSWESVYLALSSNYQNEEIKDIYPKGEDDISPWTLFSTYLIPLYFKKYIRNFVKILHKNVYEFTTNSFVRFGLTLENNYYRLAMAHTPENEIREELVSIWSKDNIDGAIGLKQCEEQLDTLDSFYKEQKNAVNRMQKGEAPDKKHMNYPGPNDFPIKKLGIFRDSFENYWKKSKKPDDRKRISSDTYGNNLLENLTKVLKYHPIPLSIIARSILMGLFLPFAVFIILRIIPDIVFDTHYFEEGVGKILLFGGIFCLSILWGLFKYWKLVLGKIKSLAYNYIGWFIYKTQKLMFEETLQKEEEYYKLCLKICDQYRNNIKSFIEANAKLKETDCKGYEQTMFQSDITKTFMTHIVDNNNDESDIIEPKILKENTIVPKAIIKSRLDYRDKTEFKVIDYEKEDEMSQLYVDIARSIINFDNDKDLQKALKDGLFPIKLEEATKLEEKEKNDLWEKVKSGIFILMNEKTKESIELFVRKSVNVNKPLSDLSDVLFYNSSIAPSIDQANHFNFTGPVTEMKDISGYIYTNTLITSRFQPSVQVTTDSPAYISIICPNMSNYGIKEWSDCFFKGMDFQTSETTGSVGLASILSIVAFNDVEGLLL